MPEMEGCSTPLDESGGGHELGLALTSMAENWATANPKPSRQSAFLLFPARFVLKESTVMKVALVLRNRHVVL